MKHASLEPAAKEVGYRTNNFLRYLRNWPANTNNPYSPVFSVALLLIVGLIVQIGH